jgi:E3 ubiquitin-protein ligase RGLG
VVGKIGTFLLWVLFLILQTATKVVGNLLVAPPREPQEEPRQEAAPPAGSQLGGGGGLPGPYEPPPQLWDPPPPPYSPPVTDEYSSSSIYRRRASAPPASEDLVVSSSGYSRSGVAAVPAAPSHAVSLPPMPRAIKTPVPIAGKLPKLERKYSKIVDEYRSLDEVCILGIW